MPRLPRPLLAVPLLAVVVGALALPGPAPAGEKGDYLAVHAYGEKAKNVSSDPMRTVFELDLFSQATGEKVGTVTDDVFCSTKTPPPCQMFDAITTFHLPDGDLVNHAQVSVVGDPQNPGWFMVHSESDENTIVNGTGAYEGRTARVRLSGYNDGSNYPNELTIDDLWVIRFDPR
ncbi:MAG TPA: hypothetical protein VI854_10370 [Acidimicrobiia bacterium]|nr:hypothetical protein [Acidimicrobiia bacterium]